MMMTGLILTGISGEERIRYAGAMQRSFYVGDAVTEEDVKAKFEDGILKLSIPKKDAKEVETKKTIAIEG